MAVIVHRVRTDPKGLWVYSNKTVDDLEAANDLAASWWSDPSTLGVVVMDGHAQDARYEKPQLVARQAELPAEWPKPPERLVMEADRRAEEARVTTGLPPTLFDAPAREKRRDPNACPCCMMPRSAPGDEGERDRTPSGRLDARRCPVCGTALQISSRQIWDLYMAYQKRLSAEHATRPKPWNDA